MRGVDELTSEQRRAVPRLIHEAVVVADYGLIHDGCPFCGRIVEHRARLHRARVRRHHGPGGRRFGALDRPSMACHAGPARCRRHRRYREHQGPRGRDTHPVPALWPDAGTRRDVLRSMRQPAGLLTSRAFIERVLLLRRGEEQWCGSREQAGTHQGGRPDGAERSGQEPLLSGQDIGCLAGLVWGPGAVRRLQRRARPGFIGLDTTTLCFHPRLPLLCGSRPAKTGRPSCRRAGAAA